MYFVCDVRIVIPDWVRSPWDKGPHPGKGKEDDRPRTRLVHGCRARLSILFLMRWQIRRWTLEESPRIRGWKCWPSSQDLQECCLLGAVRHFPVQHIKRRTIASCQQRECTSFCVVSGTFCCRVLVAIPAWHNTTYFWPITFIECDNKALSTCASQLGESSIWRNHQNQIFIRCLTDETETERNVGAELAVTARHAAHSSGVSADARNHLNYERR